MRVIVKHAIYSDRGDCGHFVQLGNYPPEFVSKHPESNDPAVTREFAEDLVREKFGEEHVADLDRENCHVLDE